MKIKVNSNWIESGNGSRLSEVLEFLALHQKEGIAIAVNDEVIPKRDWNQFLLSDDDQIVIIEASPGG